MANQGLAVNRLISVSVSLSAAAAQGQNLSTLLILGSSLVIDLVTRLRNYTSISAVAADFGTSAPEYLAAVLWFEQSPAPSNVSIGRWADVNAAGQLYGAPLSGTAQAALLTSLQAISTGSLTISINGTPHSITGLDFTAISNLNGAAAVLQTALNGLVASTTCVWNSVYGQFIVTSGTTGASSAISFATAEGTGVDVGSPMGLRSTNSGSYVVAGQLAETAIAAVTLFDQEFGQQWFALTVIGAVDADHEAIAPYIEAGTSNLHFYGVTTQEAGCLVPSSTSDIAYILAQGNYSRTAVQYSSQNAYAVVSLLSRILTVDYTGNNTVITLMYKQEPGIVPEILTETQAEALEAKFCNVFAAYNNNTAIIQDGTCSSGDFIDEVIGAMDFAVTTQTALYNALYTSPTKIPQTDPGQHILATAIEATALQFVNNGFLAPGIWDSSPFGAVVYGQYLDKGYYLYVPPIATQSPTARAARQSVAFQLAAKQAGATHKASLAITINS